MPDIYTVSNPKVLIYQLMAINNYSVFSRLYLHYANSYQQFKWKLIYL